MRLRDSDNVFDTDLTELRVFDAVSDCTNDLVVDNDLAWENDTDRLYVVETVAVAVDVCVTVAVGLAVVVFVGTPVGVADIDCGTEVLHVTVTV